MLLFKRIKPQACGTITYQGRVRPGGGKGERTDLRTASVCALIPRSIPKAKLSFYLIYT